MAASSTAPVARHVTKTSRAIGKPTPSACELGWGQRLVVQALGLPCVPRC